MAFCLNYCRKRQQRFCFHHDFVVEHLRAVSEVGSVQDGAEEPGEDEHDGPRNVIGRQQGHRDGRALRAERNFVRNLLLQGNLERMLNLILLSHPN